MTFVIHGATGAQGSPLFAALAKAGHKVVAAVRSPDAVGDLAAVAVDYSSVDSLTAAYGEASGVFVHLPVASPADRQLYAENIGEAVRRARPRRLVISTSGYAADDAVTMLVSAVARAQVSAAVLAPRLFLENLLLPVVLETVKAEGILRYPLRADYPVSWSSHLDVAEAAAKLLADPSVTGIVGVGQDPPITGADVAGGFSRYLGRPVVYEAITPGAFGEMLEPLFGPAAAAGVAASYAARGQGSSDAIASETSAQSLLGLAPRSVHQWLTDLGV